MYAWYVCVCSMCLWFVYMCVYEVCICMCAMWCGVCASVYVLHYYVPRQEADASMELECGSQEWCGSFSTLRHLALVPAPLLRAAVTSCLPC